VAGVPDLALARLTCCRRIEGDLAPARVWKAMREGAAGECRLISRADVPMVPRVRRGVAREWRLMSQAVVPMAPRVQRGVAEGAAGD